MQNYRPTRVGELLQAEIADLLLRQLKDPRLNMATISRVEVSPDLREARVYVSRVGSDSEQKETMEGFARAMGFIRGQLGKRVKLRHTPSLTFVLDTAIADGVRISRLLHDLTSTSAADTGQNEPPHA
ncbi:MAG: 30S ribosome-binding factor RbfA [Candidatus Tectomicrobia bacterium]|nr:30S ribosome-binding factor RbfA [Candidatus Tectomicrobia bacterium]